MKLLAVDMDGTCLNSQNIISDKTLSALQSAAERGVLVVPTTGRTLHWLPKRLRQWGGYRYVITSNGAKTLDVQNDRIILDMPVASETAVRLLEACKGKGLGITAHIQDNYYLQGILLMLIGWRAFRDDAAEFRYTRNMAAMIRKKNMPVEEIQIFFMKPENRPVMEEILTHFPGLSLAYDKNYVEVMAPGASKGTALAALAKDLGIASSDIACIGDNENDLPMFETAGLRFAMGNAVPALKDRADIVLPSNDEDGVAAAIWEHIL